MKSLFGFVALMLLLTVNLPAQRPKDHVDVYYFHRTTRCQTCMSIEKNTLELLNEEYKTELKSGLILFTSVEYETDSLHPLVKEYQIEGPTLLILHTQKGIVKSYDMTEAAFDYALSNPAAFKKRLGDQINELFR